MLHDFCVWLASTQWSIALHESLYMYPWIETTHVLSIAIFVGTLCFIDLRMLGLVFNKISLQEVTQRLLPWTFFGFAILIITGLLLFYAIPVRTYHSVFFRIKIILLIAAGINAYLHHRRMRQTSSETTTATRVSAICSLSAWALVIVMGRMIAYNWFDCDRQPQAEVINWFAACSYELGA